jgi:undecaprenyl diphosphate synthase
MAKITVPNHVAIAMDGNRRWARARGLDTLLGHKAGFERAIEIVKTARDLGIHTISLWGLSTENWDREKRELDYLMTLYSLMIKKYLKDALKEGVRIIHLGRKDRLPKALVVEIAEAENKTRHFDKYVLNICLDHGGRDEIVRAVQKIISDKVTSDKIDEKTFADYLDTSDQSYPYVDLFIRTSGEQRSSGMLLWQVAYAEIAWELDHLPDFTPEKFKSIIYDYSCRRRRFGANDKEEHLKFNPKVVAKLDLEWRHALNRGENERFRDLVMRYVKEQYGLSKELAKTAGIEMAKAIVYGKEENWSEAKKALEGLYGIIGKTLGLALEPKIVASLEVDLWKDGHDEGKLRKLLAEKFRFSDFQASKSAHLAFLANGEIVKNNFVKAKGHLEKFYQALKERVA